MKIFNKITIFFLLFFCTACTKVIYVPTQSQTKVEIRDSLIIRDSVVITPVERIVDIVPQYDTLHLQTSLAKSKTWVDTTTHSLKGEITNKKQTQNKNRIEVKYVNRVDSVVIEKPIPYPEPEPYVPKIYKYSMGFSIIVIVVLGLLIFLKFKK